jgi:hypothetical protein
MIQGGRVSPLLPQEESEDWKDRSLGGFRTRKAAEDHERPVQYFKRH